MQSLLIIALILYSLSLWKSRVQSIIIDASSKRLFSNLHASIFIIFISSIFAATVAEISLFSIRRNFHLMSHSYRARSSYVRNCWDSSFWVDDNCVSNDQISHNVAIERIHLIFRWWLSDRSKVRFEFRFKDCESWAWNQLINVLIDLIRINDDDDFFAFSIIRKFFTSRLIVHISQDLICIATHLDKFMKISRFVRLDDKSFLQLVWHFILKIFEKCFLIIKFEIAD
jgi:hypothetical protein